MRAAVCITFILFTSGCTGDSDEGISGVWERRYTDAVGQAYLDVMELRRDGSYQTYLQASPMNDRGRYTVNGAVIAFRSDLKPAYSQNARARLYGSKLDLAYDNAPFLNATWERSALIPNYDLASVDNQNVPGHIPDLVGKLLLAYAKPWQSDSLPVGFDVERRPAGDFSMTVRFYSPSTGGGMAAFVSKYHLATSSGDGSRSSASPLSPHFIDLPTIVELAAAENYQGQLKKAGLKTYPKSGPAWMIFSDGQARGVTFSALSGDPSAGDVTGYVDQYNADWRKLGETWGKLLSRDAECSRGKVRFSKYNGNCWSAETKDSCLLSGGTWRDRPKQWNGGWCQTSW